MIPHSALLRIPTTSLNDGRGKCRPSRRSAPNQSNAVLFFATAVHPLAVHTFSPARWRVPRPESALFPFGSDVGQPGVRRFDLMVAIDRHPKERRVDWPFFNF